MKQDSPSQTALLISKVMFLNSRRHPEYVVPATQEISELFFVSALFPKVLKPFLTTIWGHKLIELLQNRILPGFTSHVQRRKWWIYKYAKTWSEENPGSQLVVIGAGLDGLALEMRRQNAFHKVIEVDHPATQIFKQNLVRNSTLEFIPLDLTAKSITELKSHLQNSPTLVVWEGVSMYLQEFEVQKFLKDLTDILHPKSEMIWTFMVPDHQAKIRFHYGSGIIGWVLARVKEPFVWGIESNKLAAFTQSCSWTLQKEIGTYEVPISNSEPCRGEKIAVISVSK